MPTESLLGFGARHAPTKDGSMHELETGNSVESSNDANKHPVSDKLYSAVLEHRKGHFSGEREAGNSYDRWLLTLSGGALALSPSLARDIASPTGAALGGYLLTAWILLVASVWLGLLSIYNSQRADEDFRHALDDTFERTFRLNEQGSWRRVRDAENKSELHSKINRCNAWSLRCFIGGAFFLCVFACANVSHERSKQMRMKGSNSRHCNLSKERTERYRQSVTRVYPTAWGWRWAQRGGSQAHYGTHRSVPGPPVAAASKGRLADVSIGS